MKRRKVNPHRRPATQADVEKARVDGIEKGLKLMLFTLIDKHDAPMDEIQRFTAEINYMADSINKGYVDWSDIERTLKDEYDVEIRLK